MSCTYGDSHGCGHLEHPGLLVSPRIILDEVETNNLVGTGYTMLYPSEEVRWLYWHDFGQLCMN